VMEKNITKRCRACEIKFDKLKKRPKSKEFKIPSNIPVSEQMRKSIELLRGTK